MSRLSTCVLCPRLCRPACPVATATHREAATPTAIATAILQWRRGRWDEVLARQAATLCTACGACERHCHVDQPLPALLAEARAALTEEPPVEPVAVVDGPGAVVAVVTDHRDWAPALARRLNREVARLHTGDRLGVAAVEHPGFEAHAAILRARLEGREVVVADGGVASALAAAGVGFAWLHALVPELAGQTPSCTTGGTPPLACCGGAGPLPRFHPEDAVRVGVRWLRASTGDVLDSRCREHLRGCGGAVNDAVDALLASPRPAPV